ncbi:MAG: glycosyltransferase [Chitinophagaceae bacterium]|nr:glycosyltransferase [Chitinophagaceae bacterium]
MQNVENYQYSPLNQPIPIAEHQWDDTTLPLVSVSSLVYNHKAYIITCIDHLLKQKTTFRVELVIHDDASNDGTSLILQDYAARYPQLIKLITQSENLYTDNIRKIENDIHAQRRGKYIANCEGDDFWHDPLKLEKQVQFLEANPNFAGVHTRVKYVDFSGKTVGYSNKVLPEHHTATFADLVTKSMIHSVSFVYRRNVLRLNGQFIWDLTPHYYDQYLFLVTALHGKIKYLDDVTATYRINVGVFTTWNRQNKSMFTEECISFFEQIVTDPAGKQACHLKLKQVYATLYCCYAKAKSELASPYFKKYVGIRNTLCKEMRFTEYYKKVLHVEYDFIRGLFWQVAIFLSKGWFRPKGTV